MADFYASLRPASFRGLSFKIPDDEKSFGRRIQTHKYPGRDMPYHEDLGMDEEVITFQAIVTGSAFVSDADAFEAALKQKGAGTLVHPHYGAIQVVVFSGRRAQSNQSTGIVTFNVTCKIDGETLYPLAGSDTINSLSLAGDDLFSSIKAEFNDAFSVVNKPDWVFSDALNVVSRSSDFLQSSLSKGGLKSLAASLVPSSWGSLTDLADDMTGLFSSLSNSSTPKKKPVVGGDVISGTPTNPIQLIGVLSDVAGTSLNSSNSNSVVGTNEAAVDLLVRSSSLAAATKTARYAQYESREQALQYRNNLADSIDALRGDLGDRRWNKSWTAAGQALAAISSDINERIGRLPKTVEIKTNAPRSSLALSNRLYGDNPASVIGKASDIVIRNKIRHPGMVPARNLEVLIDG